jgi:hypothetical protein
MGQSYSSCTNGEEEESKKNAFVNVEEPEKGDTETTFTVLEKISKAKTRNVVFVDTTITPCSTMDTESPSDSEGEEENKGHDSVAAEEAERVDFWKASLKQTISDETDNAKVVLIDTNTTMSISTMNMMATEGVSIIEDLRQTAIEKTKVASAHEARKCSKKKKKTSTQMASTATPGKTPKKSTRSRKHKTPKKERAYAQVADANMVTVK